MTDETLKPCPFCGGRAEFKQGVYTGYVMCLKCEVMGPNLVEAEAISAWNQRPAYDPSIETKWVLVPTLPTHQMLMAMAASYDPTWGYPHNSGIEVQWAERSYRAMLAAAPRGPEEKEGKKK